MQNGETSSLFAQAAMLHEKRKIVKNWKHKLANYIFSFWDKERLKVLYIRLWNKRVYWAA